MSPAFPHHLHTRPHTHHHSSISNTKGGDSGNSNDDVVVVDVAVDDTPTTTATSTSTSGMVLPVTRKSRTQHSSRHQLHQQHGYGGSPPTRGRPDRGGGEHGRRGGVLVVALLSLLLWGAVALWCYRQYYAPSAHQEMIRGILQRERRQAEHLTEKIAQQAQHAMGDVKHGSNNIAPQQEKRHTALHNINRDDFDNIGDNNKRSTRTQEKRYAEAEGGENAQAHSQSPSAVPSFAGPADRVAVVVFTHKRPQYLKKTINTILKYLPSDAAHQSRGMEFDLFISQDGDDKITAQLIQQYVEDAKTNTGRRLHHLQKDHDPITVPQEHKVAKSYFYISHHFKFGLQKVFEHERQFSRVIILEEDIEIAPDFFDYFTAMSPFLDRDSSLLCVSAFNDNGMANNVLDPAAVYRSDFFPGLGWMMTRAIWEEIGPKWPLGFWDDWLRLPENRRGRSCIRPEVSRTYTFGEKGVSRGQFYQKYLKKINLSQSQTNWANVDLTHISSKQKYDRWLDEQVASAKEITLQERDAQSYKKVDFKIVYRSAAELKKIISVFHLMGDPKWNVPRGAYRGIITFRYKLNRMFLVPAHETLLYDNNNHKPMGGS